MVQDYSETSSVSMAEDWKRPESVPFPSVWSRFEGKREINGKIPKFWIQDIPEDMFEIAMQTMLQNFIYDESMCKSITIVDEADSMDDIKEVWKAFLQHKLGLICFMENPDPNGKPIIAGLNITYLSNKNEEEPDFKGEKCRNMLGAVLHLTHMKDPFEAFGINEYMSALGLSVLPEFRGQGIGDQLLNARTPLGKAVGLKVTLTVFTSSISQKLAKRTGFKDFCVIDYAELETINPKMDDSERNGGVSSQILMSVRVGHPYRAGLTSEPSGRNTSGRTRQTTGS
ncbi:hypothetical protein CBL_06298 [Carabus blaptoides fortunei]